MCEKILPLPLYDDEFLKVAYSAFSISRNNEWDKPIVFLTTATDGNDKYKIIQQKALQLLKTIANKYTETINDIIVATTDNPLDDKIEGWCKANNTKYFRGSEGDVLNRYYSASQEFPSDFIVRITADDPFKEPTIIDKVVKTLVIEKLDYVTNNFPLSFPVGLDCEAFTRETLEKMELYATENIEREHVTQYIFRHLNEFRIKNISSDRMLKHYRWTIDTENDSTQNQLLELGRGKKTS